MVVRETQMPEPEGGQVRLKVRFCGICGSDLTVFKTGALSGPDVVMGHEISAVVDLDPEGPWAPGTRVTPFPARGRGKCTWGLDRHPRDCVNPPYGEGGRLADHAVSPSAGLIPR